MATPNQAENISKSLVHEGKHEVVKPFKPKLKKGKKKYPEPSKIKNIVKDIARITSNNNKEYNPAMRDMQITLQRGMLGTLMGPDAKVRIRLPLLLYDMQSSAGALIQTTYGVAAANISGWADWQTVFATYRIVDVELIYTPYFAGSATNTGQIAGAFDYGATPTAAASFAAVMQMDGPKVIPLFKRGVWYADFKGGYTDMLEVTNTTTYYAYWKTYSSGNSGVGVSTYYGSLTGWATVEFQGFY